MVSKKQKKSSRKLMANRNQHYYNSRGHFDYDNFSMHKVMQGWFHAIVSMAFLTQFKRDLKK